MSNYTTTTSYYKTSGPPSGMSRGRGSYGMRGSLRGRGSSDGGSWGTRGRGRGGYIHQSRGGGSGGGGGPYSGSNSGNSSWYNKDPSQQSYRNDRYQSTASRPTESRYPPARGGGSSDYNSRYSRRDGPPSYSSNREHQRSPDPVARKRMRPDGYSPAASRRSHDGGYEYSSSRYEYVSDKGSCSSEDRGRPVHREERRPSADRRDDYHSPRGREPSGSSMPPPPAPTRGGTSYRSRGGGIRGRGVTRVFTRRPTDVSLAARKRSFIESYVAKRRILTAKGSLDYYKRLRSMKLSTDLSGTYGTRMLKSEVVEGDDIDDWDDDPDDKEAHSDEEDLNPGREEDENIDDEKKKKVVNEIVKKVVKKKFAPSADHDSQEVPKDGDDLDRAADVQETEEEETMEEEVEADGGDNEPKMQVTIKQDSEARAVSDETVRKSISGKTGYKYIKLFCPHCSKRYITFKEYQNHLRGLHHVNAMRQLSFRLKQNLARMRVEQRVQQRLNEKNDELRGVTGGRTNYCQTCKLNYRQDRTRHNESEMHKKMKEFLMPTCVICRINFRSPMLYENHICSLEHIKFWSSVHKDPDGHALVKLAEPGGQGLIMMEERVLKGRDRETNAEKEVDMDSLLVLDSVGSADESDSDEEADGEKLEGKDSEKKEKKKKKAQINLGADYVKKVEVMYCELCAIYLPRTGEEDVALANHCRTRNHLQRYVRYKDDRALRKEAERIHRRDKAEQEARSRIQEVNKEDKNDGSTSSTEKLAVIDENIESKVEHASGTTESSEAGGDSVDLDDKIWADVDKGLDELLREVEPGNKSSDDDDESGRYDRFRYSDKKSGKGSSDDLEAAGASNSNNAPGADLVSKQESTSPKED